MSQINKIGVIGAGNMGSGIAQKMAQEGLNVVMVDITEYNPMMDSRSFQTATVVRQLMQHFIYGKAAAMRGVTDPFHYHPDMVDDGF